MNSSIARRILMAIAVMAVLFGCVIEDNREGSSISKEEKPDMSTTTGS